MSHPLVVILIAQGFYTVSDLMGRYYMHRLGFQASAFITPWFLGYFLLRQVAMFGQLYVFAHVPLGKTIAILSAASIVFSNALGFLLLGEILSPVSYFGVSLAVVAVLIMAFR